MWLDPFPPAHSLVPGFSYALYQSAVQESRLIHFCAKPYLFISGRVGRYILYSQPSRRASRGRRRMSGTDPGLQAPCPIRYIPKGRVRDPVPVNRFRPNAAGARCHLFGLAPEIAELVRPQRKGRARDHLRIFFRFSFRHGHAL